MPLTKAKAFGALLTDLSKAFHCLCHDFLIIKQHTYGLDISSLNLLQDYSANCKQRTKVESFLVPGKIFSKYFLWSTTRVYSRSSCITFDANLFCSKFLCVAWFLTLKTVYFSGYADDNGPFSVANSINDVM